MFNSKKKHNVSRNRDYQEYLDQLNPKERLEPSAKLMPFVLTKQQVYLTLLMSQWIEVRFNKSVFRSL